MAAEGLEIELPFPGGAEEPVPVCFVLNVYSTSLVKHTLVACDFGDIDQIGGVAISSVVTWYGGDLVAKACKTYWLRPAGRCLGMSSAW